MITTNQLKAHVRNTMQNRGTTSFFKNYEQIISALRESEVKQLEWEQYQSEFPYAKGISFTETLDECKAFCDNAAPYFP